MNLNQGPAESKKAVSPTWSLSLDSHAEQISPYKTFVKKNVPFSAAPTEAA